MAIFKNNFDLEEKAQLFRDALYKTAAHLTEAAALITWLPSFYFLPTSRFLLAHIFMPIRASL